MKTTFFPTSKLTLSLAAAGLLAAAPFAWSDHHNENDGHDDHGHEEPGHDENRQLGAHVHGAAQLLVARDHDHVTVLLSSPSINVVGFEHHAQNDADRETLRTAEALLSDPDNVFALTAAAQCALESVHIQSEQLAEMQSDGPQESHHGHDGHDGHDDHGHHTSGQDEHGHDSHGHDGHGHNEHEHGHDDHHDNGEHGHDDHGHDDHEHDHADGSVHSEFNVEYEFHCASPNRMTGLQVNVFDAFRGFETVDVQWILDGEQGAQRSQPRSTRVTF